MATAALQFSFLQSSIDADKGVIRGVKIAELGKVAVFKGPDGKPRKAEITKEHADAFLAHAGNRAIPVHWTHDYLSDDADRLHAKVGALKNFRKDGDGNPIADFYVAPTDYRDNIFWSAENDPENMMFSAVFSYDPKDPKSLPQDFQAADLVECGAATTALFSQPNNTMTAEEIKSHVAEAVKSALAEYATKADESAKAELASAKQSADAEIAALKAELSGVDAKIEAKAKEVAAAELTLAEARFAANIGKSGSFKPEGDNKIAAMSRADFSKLSPAEQREFILTKRGKVQD